MSTKAPDTIACRVAKKSQWVRDGDAAKLKSISLEVLRGKFYATGDENTPDYSHGSISLTVYEGVETFFDAFEVGQVVDLQIKHREKS